MSETRLREEIADYLRKKFDQYHYEDSVPEHDKTWFQIDHRDYLKIADGLIPMIKNRIKKGGNKC